MIAGCYWSGALAELMSSVLLDVPPPNMDQINQTMATTQVTKNWLKWTYIKMTGMSMMMILTICLLWEEEPLSGHLPHYQDQPWPGPLIRSIAD